VEPSFRSQGNHRNQIFSVISQDIEEQVATDYSIIATWIWHLQPLWVREISRIHIEFLFRKFAAIESKEKGPPNFKVRCSSGAIQQTKSCLPS
jgi:hypothetical protein